MDTAPTPAISRSWQEPGAAAPSHLLFDRAGLNGLVCAEAGWDDWDTCVIEQDIRAELQALRPTLH